MATIAGKPFSQPKNINLKYGILRFGDTHSSAPLVGSSDDYLYINDSHQIVYQAQGSSSILGTAGSLANFSLNDAYDDGSTITVDAGAVTLAGSHGSNNVLALTLTGTGTGNMIDIQNNTSGTAGSDIIGTDDTWSVSSAGAAIFVGITPGGDITSTALAVDWDLIDNNASALSFDAAGSAGLIAIVTTDTGPGVTMSGLLTVAGIFTASTGIVMSDGQCALTDDANDAESLILTNDTATTFGNASDEGVVRITAAKLSTGALLNLSLDASELNGGWYLRCWEQDAAGAVWSVGEDGVTTIAGKAGSNMLVVTAGDVVFSDASVSITDADDANSLIVTNDTATTSDVIQFIGAGVFTGTGADAFVNITQSGANTGDVMSVIANGLTSGTVLLLSSTGTVATTGAMLEIVADSATSAAGLIRASADGLVDGDVVNITCTAGNALTSGELLDISHVSGNITGTLNKSGNLFAFLSDRTVTTGTVADDYDMLSVIRGQTINGAGSFAAAGSVVYIENQVTNTSGTTTDTVIGLEITMDSLGTGAGAQITHAATGGIALSVIGAATSVDDVLIATTGVKAINKAALQVTNSGHTAAGGSIFRVINTGTPAAATSYLVDFDYGGATMTNNPTTIYINGKDSTNSTVEINSSGASAANKGMLSLLNSNTGATGVVLHAQHTSTGSAADDDAVFTLKAEGLDSANNVTEYGRLEVEIMNKATGEEDGRFILSASANNGTLTQMVAINPRAGGALAELVLGSTAGNAYVTTTGTYDLILDTNQGTNAGTITLTDGVNGAITFAPNGTGSVVVTPSSGAALTTALNVSVGDIVMGDGVLKLATSAGVTADVGSAQGNGVITRSVVEISVCGNAGDAATLPSAVAGMIVIITNHGANAADVFPASGDNINETGANAAVSCAANETLFCFAYDTTHWEALTMART